MQCALPNTALQAAPDEAIVRTRPARVGRRSKRHLRSGLRSAPFAVSRLPFITTGSMNGHYLTFQSGVRTSAQRTTHYRTSHTPAEPIARRLGPICAKESVARYGDSPLVLALLSQCPRAMVRALLPLMPSCPDVAALRLFDNPTTA